jgi:hypothetical protein
VTLILNSEYSTYTTASPKKNTVLFLFVQKLSVMSSRALRRLQKDQIPDIVNADKSDQESEEEDYVEQKKPAFNPFDLVNQYNFS